MDADGRSQAVRWRPGGDIASVQSLLQSAGVDTTGWQLTEARAVSPDGSVISGKGIDPYGTTTGWIATVSPLPLYTFLGFDRPLKNWPFSNSVKAGSTVPISGN